jgi:hypothetical protein
MSLRRLGLALAVIVLLAVVLAEYYVVHKPLGPEQALRLVETAANSLIAGLLVVLAGGVGHCLWRAGFSRAAEPEPAASTAYLALALGWGALGLGLLLLGAARLYYPAVLWLLVAGLLLGLRRDIRSWLLAVRQSLRGLTPAGRLEGLAAVFTLLVLSLGFLRALAPPTMWDALVYHLTLPKLYIQAHSIWIDSRALGLMFGFPQLNEMLFTAARLLRLDGAAGDIAAQLLGWCFGAALCLGLVTHARELGLPGWLAAALLFSSLTLALALAWAYAELLMLLFALSTLVALHTWQRHRLAGRRARRWLVLAGVFAGLACGCKYPGILVPLGCGVAVLAVELGLPGRPRARVIAALNAGLLLSASAALTFAPWLLKNWLSTGNPLYPLVWPAAGIDALQQWFYSRPDQAEPLWQAAPLLIRATLFGVQSGNVTDATLGPLLLLGAGLLLCVWPVLARSLRRDLALIAVFAAAAYLGWVVLDMSSGMARQARPYVSVLLALALLGAGALGGFHLLDTPQFKLSTIVNALVALVLSLGAVELGLNFVNHDPLPYLAGAQSATDYEAARLGWYVPALAAVNALPAGSDVLFLWEPRTLGCVATVHCRPDAVVDRWWHTQRLGLTANQALEQWRADGVTHLLFYEAGASFMQSEPDSVYAASDWTELAALRQGLQPLATFGAAYTLYALP